MIIITLTLLISHTGFILFHHSKQKGIEAQKANNLFYHLTYYEPEEMARIVDED